MATEGRMNPDIKAQWVEALESSRYAQGQGRLCTIDADTGKLKFCCLGVLCEVLGVERDEDGSYGGQVHLLPKSVADAAGLTDSPIVQRNGFNMSIASVNDEGTSFAEIAKIIREQL